MTAALNERFSPEIIWESLIHRVRGYEVGIIYFAEASQKPVVCTRNAGGGTLKEGAIYYRYRGRSESIHYPELRRILDDERDKERSLWFKQIKKIAEIGVGHAGILDLQSGEVSGAKGAFFISDELLPKLKFLQEGHFVNQEGAPALKLIGEVQVVEGPILSSTVRVPTSLHDVEIVGAFLREDSVLSLTDYLKAVCNQQSVLYPLYFFINQTNQSVKENIDLIQTFEIRGRNKEKVVQRLLNQNESFSFGKIQGSGAAAERKMIIDQIHSKTIPSTAYAENRKRLFEAFTHLTDSTDVQYVRSFLRDEVLPNFTKLSPAEASIFRKVICHIDALIYRAQIA